MPDELDELSLIKFEVGSPPKNGKAAELYDQEVREYEHADAGDPDQLFDKKLRLAFHQRELRQIDDLITARNTYADKIFVLVVRWLIGVAVVLLLQGFHVFSFSLPEKVLLALVGGTTLNVIGIFTIVANFLFSKGASTMMMKMKSMRKANNSTKTATTRTRKPKVTPSQVKQPEPTEPAPASDKE